MNSYLVNKQGTLSIQRQNTPPSGTLTVISGDWYSDQVQYFTPYRAYYDPEQQTQVRLADGENPPAEITWNDNGVTRSVIPSEYYSYDFDQSGYDADKAAKEAQATAKAQAESAYQYAVARGSLYVQEFSEAPEPSQIDAIGHLIDDIITAISTGDTTVIEAHKAKIDAIKTANPA